MDVCDIYDVTYIHRWDVSFMYTFMYVAYINEYVMDVCDIIYVTYVMDVCDITHIIRYLWRGALMYVTYMG